MIQPVRRTVKLSLWLLFLLLVFSGCRTTHQRVSENGLDFKVEYARDFRVERFDAYTVVYVYNPWDTLQVLQRYVLVDRDKPLPEDLPQGVLIRTPLRRVVVYSAVHCGMMEELGVADRIVGVCEPYYIDLDFIRDGVKQGTVADLGEASAPDVEQVIDLSPDALIVSPFKNVGYGRVEKIGIPILECVDYMEQTPLGRAEWMRFMALFFDREVLADSLFNQTVTAYDSLCNLVAGTTYRPTVLSEKKYGSAWYIPGGVSYVAHLFRDAGADYIWRDDPSSGSVPLAFETVFERGEQADYWIIKYNATTDLTYKELQKEFEPYRHFGAFKKQNIFVCNTGKVPYYEELPMHPDRVLRDLIRIFHPDRLPDERFRYFNRMQE